MRVLSGIQPSGVLHVGNYFGAIKQWLELQKEGHELMVMIADLHAITVPYEKEALAERTGHVAADLLALGIDPAKTILFVQSQVPEHSELTWLLHAVAPLGQLQRMTQFKEKSARHKQSVAAGLLAYPVLQAADILLYDTELVPVGQDQKQHVEFTRDLAQRFNARFGEVFVLPEAQILKTGARLKSLLDPDRKMSKSDPPAGFVALADEPEVIKAKLSRAITDSRTSIEPGEQSPGMANLLNLYSLAAGRNRKELLESFIGRGYADFKAGLAETLAGHFSNYRARRNELTANPQTVKKTLADGAVRARALAAKKIVQVKKAMGFLI